MTKTDAGMEVSAKVPKALSGPKRYPLTLKRFLVICLPTLYHRPKRREAAWREFRKSDWAQHSHFSFGRSSQKTIKEFTDWISQGNDIPDQMHYVILARCFL